MRYAYGSMLSLLCIGLFQTMPIARAESDDAKRQEFAGLMQKIRTEPWTSASSAAKTLVETDRASAAVSELRKVLESHARPVDEDGIRQCIQDTGHAKFKVRNEASDALLRYGQAARPHIRQAMSTTEDPESLERLRTVLAQLEINAGRGQLSSPQRQEIMETLRGLNALANAGADVSSCLPCVSEVLPLDDMELALPACLALGRMGPAAAPAVPKLIELVYTGDESCRPVAINTLGQIGPAAAPATGVLIKAATTAPVNSYIWEDTTLALGRMGNTSYLPRIRQMLTGDDPVMQGSACAIIVGYRDESLAQLPRLIALAKSDDIPPADRAIAAVASLGEPGLRAVLKEFEQEKQAGRMAETLRAFPKDELFCKIAVPPLKTRFAQEGSEVNTYVHEALCMYICKVGVTEQTQPLLDDLTACLTHNNRVMYFAQNFYWTVDSQARFHICTALRKAMNTPATRDWAAIVYIRLSDTPGDEATAIVQTIVKQATQSAKEQWLISLIEAAFRSFPKLGEQPEDVIAATTELASTGDDDNSIRIWAIRAIPHMTSIERAGKILDKIEQAVSPAGYVARAMKIARRSLELRVKQQH
jgi:HEAT repeat protein